MMKTLVRRMKRGDSIEADGPVTVVYKGHGKLVFQRVPTTTLTIKPAKVKGKK